MTTLYYTIDIDLYEEDETFATLTGIKIVSVYEIANDTPKLWFDFECDRHKNTIKEIQNWLDENGFGERQYNFVQL